MNFQVGDVVRRKDTLQDMDVESVVEGGEMTCTWLEGGVVKKDKFRPEAVILVSRGAKTAQAFPTPETAPREPVPVVPEPVQSARPFSPLQSPPATPVRSATPAVHVTEKTEKTEMFHQEPESSPDSHSSHHKAAKGKGDHK